MPISNPNRSGGPRTLEGKSNSSRNALKAGAYSMQLILPGEPLSDYEALLEQFQSDFAPRDIVEKMMVGEMANLTWKQMRLEKFSHTVLINAMNPAVTPSEFQKISPAGYTDERFECIQKLGDADFDAQVSQHREMIPLLERLIAKPTLEDLATFKEKWPEQFDVFKKKCDKVAIYRGDFDEFILTAELKSTAFQKVPLVELFLSSQLLLASNMVWVHENRDSIEQALQAVKADRAMTLLQGRLSSRGYDDLQRAFFRTLNEFKRHQKWRREQRVVQVDTFESKPEPEPELSFHEDSNGRQDITFIDSQIEQILNEDWNGPIDDEVY